MNARAIHLPAQEGNNLTTYTFKVVVEPDDGAWHAYCPALLEHGGATWGETREEALRNIEEVVKMVVESMLEHGEALPLSRTDQVQVSEEPLVAVTV
jgi:predicted RNase H-like HicB family nuclease